MADLLAGIPAVATNPQGTPTVAKAGVPNEHPLDGLIFSRSRRFVYAPVPKAACSSMKAYLRRIEGYSNELDVHQLHDKRRNGLYYASSLTRSQMVDALFARNGYFKFTVVRNPFARVVSAYRDLLTDRDGGGPRLGATHQGLLTELRLQRDARPSELTSITFEDFIRSLEHKRPADMDRHWQPQSYLTVSGLLSYDLVVRLEQLDGAAPELADRLGTDLMVSERLNSVEGAPTDLVTWFPEDLERIVLSVYASDFQRFGYPRSAREADRP
jgi:hypothetical protein